MDMDFASRIQKLRKQAGLSQEALAEMLGVSRQALGKWESGASVPTLENLVQLASIFHISVDELATGQAAADAQTPSGGAPDPQVPLPGARSRAEKRAAAWICAAIGALAAALITLAIVQGVQIRGLKQENARLGDRLSEIASRPYDGALSAQITQQVLASLRDADGVTDAAFSWSIERADAGAGTVTIALSARPQTIREGETVAFLFSPSADSPDTLEKPLTFPAALEDGQYASLAEIPICSAADVYIQTTDADGTMQQKYADCLYGLRRKVLPSIDSSSDSFGFRISGDTLRFFGTPCVYVTAPELPDAPAPATLLCTLYLGDEPVYEKEFDVKRDLEDDAFSRDVFEYPAISPAVAADGVRSYCYWPDPCEEDDRLYDFRPDTSVFWRFLLTDSDGAVYESVLRYN